MEQTFMKEKKILPLVLTMSLPMVLSMMVNSLYNIIDSYFVAKISEDAMTALSLVFPLQNLVNAVTIGFGVGINAVIAYYLGAQESWSRACPWHRRSCHRHRAWTGADGGHLSALLFPPSDSGEASDGVPETKWPGGPSAVQCGRVSVSYFVPAVFDGFLPECDFVRIFAVLCTGTGRILQAADILVSDRQRNRSGNPAADWI